MVETEVGIFGAGKVGVDEDFHRQGRGVVEGRRRSCSGGGGRGREHREPFRRALGVTQQSGGKIVRRANRLQRVVVVLSRPFVVETVQHSHAVKTRIDVGGAGHGDCGSSGVVVGLGDVEGNRDAEYDSEAADENVMPVPASDLFISCLECGVRGRDREGAEHEDGDYQSGVQDVSCVDCVHSDGFRGVQQREVEVVGGQAICNQTLSDL